MSVGIVSGDILDCQHLTWKDEGITGFVVSKGKSYHVPIFRLYNPKIGDHYYCCSEKEKREAEGQGYKFERIEGYGLKNAPGEPFVPLYVLYQAEDKNHFYTTSDQERKRAISKFKYRSKGILCYISTIKLFSYVPLFRLYNAKTRDHLYTTSAEERYQLMNK